MVIPKFMGRDNELSSTGWDGEGEALDSWKVTQAVLAQMEPAFATWGKRVWTRASGRSYSGGGYSGGGYSGGGYSGGGYSGGGYSGGGYSGGGYSGGGYSGGGYGGSQWSSSGWGGGSASAYSCDCLRHWVGNGQCYYADMGHVEVCTGVALSPYTFAAQCLSTLIAAEEARRLAQLEAPDGTHYSLAACNVDVLDPSISWGTHLNVSVSKQLFDDLFLGRRRPAVLGYVVSALAAAIPFFGTGYLMPTKDGPTVYSLSARAHHLSRISTLATTEAWNRGLLNERREAHAHGQDRLHLIGFDFSLAGAALMGSFVQCLLAAAEAGYCRLNLYEPVRALREWSWGLDLSSGRLPVEAMMADGRSLSLPSYMAELTTELLQMCESGLIPETVAPGARELLPIILDLCGHLEHGALAQCAPHLDWAAKLLYLLDGSQREGFVLGDARSRLLDHDFANTNPAEGPFWNLWDAGRVDPLVDRATVLACLADGPVESRDWGRGRLIEQFADRITAVDWSYIDLRRGEGRWDQRLRVEMPTPDSFGRDRVEPLLDGCDDVGDFETRLEEDGDGGDGGVLLTDPLMDPPMNLSMDEISSELADTDSSD
jgi:hypothetical protein